MLHSCINSATRILVPLLVFLVFCGTDPLFAPPSKTGQLEIRTRMNVSSLAKTTEASQTLYDSLVIRITAPDMTPMRIAKRIDPYNPSFTDTLSDVPAGKNRSITIKAVNSDIETHIDSVSNRTVDIDPDETSTVFVTLIPAAGSIYIQLGAIPVIADSIQACFISSGDTLYEVKEDRKPKVFLSIDNIPHEQQGSLYVTITNSQGNTLYTAHQIITFDARADNFVFLDFITEGGDVECVMNIRPSGVTLASYSFKPDQHPSTETGDLIISEIMYAANDSEYIELYNPSNLQRAYDTLIIDIDGIYREFFDIAVDPDSFLVIGRKALPYVDLYHETISALDLSSNGNWITIRTNDGTIFDQVIFTGVSNSVEWPTFSGKKSVELDRNMFNPVSNNLGRNWITATELIEGLSQFGTPGY
ncbi:MAG: hypothetical protein ACOCW1_00220 [Chitinispirillaceae bacterium]